jgi:hypothetical protein
VAVPKRGGEEGRREGREGRENKCRVKGSMAPFFPDIIILTFYISISLLSK